MQYLLAAQADEVYLDPMGGLMLEGLGRYHQYYREGLQDKLGVDVHVFKVGQYKSAVEPFTRDDASPEAKEADLYWMNDVWQRYLADVAKVRKLTPARLVADIDNLPAGIEAAGGDLAKYALQHKLVDGLKTQEQVEDLLAERGAADADADGGFRQVSLDAYLQQLHAPLTVDERPQVAVVVAEGAIAGGEQPAGSIGGESTAALLREARDDEGVKAVVLRVDSPGGEVFASEQIRREVVALKEAGKPVVVSMGDLAASGGYWISMNADRIYADPSTNTRSNGIFGMIPPNHRPLGLTRRRGVRLRTDPPRGGRAEGSRQARGRFDGRPGRVRRLLDQHERRPHLRRPVDDHRLDRHLRHDPDHPAHAGEDRRAHRRRRHHALRRRVRHHPAAGPRSGAGDPVGDREGLPRLHRPRRQGARPHRGADRRSRPRPRVERRTGEGARAGRRVRRPARRD